MQYAVKIIVTALLVVGISEVSKRSQGLGAVLASLPITSILAIIWFYCEGGSAEQTASLTLSIFYMVIPSLVFFLAFPLLLKYSVNFWISMLVSSGLTFGAYVAFFRILAAYKLVDVLKN